MTKRDFTALEQEMIDNVVRHGWHCMNVLDPSGETEPFSYSIGFTKTCDSSECICFGLPNNLMHNMLWELFRQVEAGACLSHGKRWQGLLEGYDCITMRATHKDLMSEYTTSAGWYGRNVSGLGEPEVYQIVWPGSGDGLFPWEEGCSQDVIDAQPRLWNTDLQGGKISD